MQVVVQPAPETNRHESSRSRRRRDDVWIATTGLIAAFLALPFAQSSWHGAEAAAVLAVSATAMFAGQRWAIALVVLAELFLLPTILPRAFVPPADLHAHLAALFTLAAIVPGVLAMRRAAAALVIVTGRPRTQRTCRRFHLALVVTAVVATVLPIL
ncbi:MAG: hypothetical protein H0T79_12855 [Deltaproteobacteria bacterium]|nr:hypothetical protein [Deltaproteobacteria bacterium]